MKQQITITWNAEQSPETKITTSQAFKDMEWIERADCLKDALIELEDIYNRTLAESPFSATILFIP